MVRDDQNVFEGFLTGRRGEVRGREGGKEMMKMYSKGF